jgi:hypothetical protein
MKYFIVGLHSSGKQEVLDTLEKMDIKCGKLFANLDEPHEEIYNSFNYIKYNDEDINSVFENNAYIFIQELPFTTLNFKPAVYYEGLSKYEFDNNDVFILSPDQLISITPNTIKDDVCFIWLDNTKDNRSSRYYNEKRSYNYNERDAYEKRDLNIYVKMLYSFDNSRLIYFNNEVPNRIATITYAMIKHPDLIDTFVKNFD